MGTNEAVGGVREAACRCGAPDLVYAATAFADEGDLPMRRLVCPRCGADGPADEAASPGGERRDATSTPSAWAVLAAVATASLAFIALA